MPPFTSSCRYARHPPSQMTGYPERR